MAGLEEYFRTLLGHYGRQGWWPAESPFEVMVGAILAQNTAWTNVERAIAALRERRLLEPRRLRALPTRALARAIRPAGTFNVKARRLKNFLAWFVGAHQGDVERLRRIPLARLRGELLGVSGIGPETADSILLYALGFPAAVADAYTHRVLSRHALVPESADYDGMKEFLERALPRRAKTLNEFHALIVAVGKEFCRLRPRCETCPLRKHLPRAGRRSVRARRVQ
jgi:endonuclease-3 related protein